MATVKKRLSIKTKRILQKYIMLFFANLILALSTVIFYDPFSIVAGGVSGIAFIFDYFSGGNLLDVYVYGITFILIVVSFFTLGKKVTVRSLFSTLLYPVLLTVVYRIPGLNSIGQYFVNIDGINLVENISQIGSLGYGGVYLVNYLICAIFGGLLCGLSVAIAFSVGGTTGGIDILVLVFKKYIKKFNESFFTFLLDGSIIVIGIGVFTLKNNDNPYYLATSCFNILSALICSITIEVVYIMRSNDINCEIITNKWQELNDYFINVLERGTTIYDVKGGYKLENRKVVKMIINKKEYEKVKEKIEEVDPEAFVTFTPTKKVIGLGFTRENPFE